MSVPTPPGPDATPAEIEAHIAATRARLTGSIDVLAERVDVKARAQEKVEEAKSAAQAKVEEAKTAAQAKVADARVAAQARASEGREKVVQGAQEVEQRVRALPLPAQIALAAVPVLVVTLLIIRKVRS